MLRCPPVEKYRLTCALAQIPLLRMRLVNEFGARALPDTSSSANLSNATTSKGGAAQLDRATEMMQAFKQLEIEKKNEMLKRLIDCQREPAMGPDPVEIVMMGFKTLSEGEKREMLKRLIDL